MTKKEFVKLGRDFAANKKNAAKIRRLSAFVDKWESFTHSRNLITEDQNQASALCERMFFTMCPQHDSDREESASFWFELCGAEYPKDTHVEAFVHEAVWQLQKV